MTNPLSNQPTDFPSTRTDEVLAFNRAAEINCPYLYSHDRYSNLDQCLRPDACTCWHDVQILRMTEEDRSFHSTRIMK